MSYFRNKQVKKEYTISIFISIAAVGIAFGWEFSFGIFTAVLCFLFNVVHYIHTYLRYRTIQSLSSDIDQILHEDISIVFEKYEEGELAILESEIQKMTTRLREQRQQLMADKKYLADSIADISHQIRTPLTSINLLLSFLSETGISEERRQKTIREIYELLSRIDWLITTLLKISKLEAGTIQLKFEELELEQLVRQSLAPLLIAIELRGQELKVHTEGKFRGDLDWMSEAVGNIVKNCMEHTPEGGQIAITASENTLYSEIIISDTGNGIAPKDLPYIFERFYKGQNCKDKSFGIGLALARGIIHNQNGTIKAENKKESGAKFTIRMYKELSG